MPDAGEPHRPDLPGEAQPGVSEPPSLREQGPQEVSERQDAQSRHVPTQALRWKCNLHITILVPYFLCYFK